MALTTRDGYYAMVAAAQRVLITRGTARTTISNLPFSVFDLAGEPSGGVLAGTSTAAGVVPNDSTPGCPTINPYTGANLGYVTRVEMSNTQACRIALYDMIFKAGAYAFNAAVTLASQPSYASRMTFNGSVDYKGTELWLECVTAITGTQNVAITYTNESGTAGKTTGTVATTNMTLGRMFRIPLAAGDNGIQKVESVTGSVSSAGTFNVLVMRKLVEGRVRVGNDQIILGPDLTGMPQIHTDAALVMVVYPDSASTAAPEVYLSVGNA